MAQQQTNAILDTELNGDSFHHFVPHFLESASEHDHTKLNTHAAWYKNENHETVSVMKVRTTRITLGASMLALV